MTNQMPPIPICESCLNLKVYSGDRVPYGSTTAQLPDEWECNFQWPDADPDWINDQIDQLFQGALQTCKYFKPFPFCKKHPDTRTTPRSDTGCPKCDEIFYKKMEEAEKASEEMMKTWQEVE